MASQPNLADQHLLMSGLPYCSNPDCPQCRELRAAMELAQAGKGFRLTLIRPRGRSTKAD